MWTLTLKRKRPEELENKQEIPGGLNHLCGAASPGHMTLETSPRPPLPLHHRHPHPTLLSSNPGLYSPKLILEIEKLKHCSFTIWHTNAAQRCS